MKDQISVARPGFENVRERAGRICCESMLSHVFLTDSSFASFKLLIDRMMFEKMNVLVKHVPFQFEGACKLSARPLPNDHQQFPKGPARPLQHFHSPRHSEAQRSMSDKRRRILELIPFCQCSRAHRRGNLESDEVARTGLHLQLEMEMVVVVHTQARQPCEADDRGPQQRRDTSKTIADTVQ